MRGERPGQRRSDAATRAQGTTGDQQSQVDGWKALADLAAAGIEVAQAVRGDGTSLPFADGTFDITYSSNVAEHIPNPWDMGEEMLRVTKPGGLVVLSYTVWLGPFGGHETGLWEHYVGGEFARDRYTRRHGHPPKNVFGSSLFALSAREGLDLSLIHI